MMQLRQWMPKSWKERRGADRAAENDKEAQREGLNAGVFALRAALILLLCVGVVVLLKYAVEHRRYTAYEVVSSEEREDSVSSYTYVGGRVLRYSADGATLMKQNMDLIWSQAYDMTQPTVVTKKKTIAIYDRRGSAVYTFDETGMLGSFRTEAPILFADVTENGSVALGYEEGSGVRIGYYTPAGAEIAVISSQLSSGGCPIALAVSENGENLAVSYVTADNGTIGSRLSFYNFAGTGAAKSDNEVASEEFKGTIIPRLIYFRGSRLAAVRDNGFTLYEGTVPTKRESVDFEEEIVSVFHEGSYMGFIFRDDSRVHRYLMQIYNTSGRLLSDSALDLIYDTVDVCGSTILFYNDYELAVYNTKGMCQFSGILDEGNMKNVVLIGSNRYFLVTDMKTEKIRLK